MLYEELRNEIKKAIKAQDKIRLSILRQVLGDIDAFSKDTQNTEITEEIVNNYIRKTIKQTTETYDASVKANNNEVRTKTLEAQIAILNEMVPKQVTGETLNSLVKDVISEIGATSMKDMCVIITKLNEKTNGNFDKSQASQFAKELLL